MSKDTIKYVDRVKAMNAIYKCISDQNEKMDAIGVIAELPYRTFEDKTGHWILERDEDGQPVCYHCSECDPDRAFISIKMASDYCPNCGIRMSADIEDPDKP